MRQSMIFRISKRMRPQRAGRPCRSRPATPGCSPGAGRGTRRASTRSPCPPSPPPSAIPRADGGGHRVGAAGRSAPGSDQVVMATGQEESSTARAASAGLKMLYPMPPKSCLTRKMATKAPDRDHPQRRGGRAGEGEQQPGDHGAAVARRVIGRLNTSWLRTSRGQAARPRSPACTARLRQPKMVDRGHGGGRERDDHATT